MALLEKRLSEPTPVVPTSSQDLIDDIDTVSSSLQSPRSPNAEQTQIILSPPPHQHNESGPVSSKTLRKKGNESKKQPKFVLRSPIDSPSPDRTLSPENHGFYVHRPLGGEDIQDPSSPDTFTSPSPRTTQSPNQGQSITSPLQYLQRIQKRKRKQVSQSETRGKETAEKTMKKNDNQSSIVSFDVTLSPPPSISSVDILSPPSYVYPATTTPVRAPLPFSVVEEAEAKRKREEEERRRREEGARKSREREEKREKSEDERKKEEKRNWQYTSSQLTHSTSVQHSNRPRHPPLASAATAPSSFTSSAAASSHHPALQSESAGSGMVVDRAKEGETDEQKKEDDGQSTPSRHAQAISFSPSFYYLSPQKKETMNEAGKQAPSVHPLSPPEHHTPLTSSTQPSTTPTQHITSTSVRPSSSPPSPVVSAASLASLLDAERSRNQLLENQLKELNGTCEQLIVVLEEKEEEKDRMGEMLDHLSDEVKKQKDNLQRHEKLREDERRDARKALVDEVKANVRREEKKKEEEWEERRKKIGNIVTVYDGVRYVEAWEDGTEFTQVKQAEREIEKKRREGIEEMTSILNTLDTMLSSPNPTRPAAEHDLHISYLFTDLHRLIAAQHTLNSQLEAIDVRRLQLELEKTRIWQEIRRRRSQSSAPLTGNNLVNRFVFGSLLGAGGFSEVWRGYDILAEEDDETRDERRRVKDEDDSKRAPSPSGQNNQHVLWQPKKKKNPLIQPSTSRFGVHPVALKIHRVNQQWNRERKAAYIRHVVRECVMQSEMVHPHIVQMHQVTIVDDNSIVSTLTLCEEGSLDEKIQEKMSERRERQRVWEREKERKKKEAEVEERLRKVERMEEKRRADVKKEEKKEERRDDRKEDSEKNDERDEQMPVDFPPLSATSPMSSPSVGPHPAPHSSSPATPVFNPLSLPSPASPPISPLQTLLFSESEVRILLSQTLQALVYLSSSSLSHKVIHYDLKPANLLFHKGRLLVSDFGLSKQVKKKEERGKEDKRKEDKGKAMLRDDESDGEDDEEDTAKDEWRDDQTELTSQGAGTYWYLPPECFRPSSTPGFGRSLGEREDEGRREERPRISPKVDVWSVGVLCYQLLFARRPFGHDMSPAAILSTHTIYNAHQVPFPNIAISEACRNFVTQCLQHNPSQRLDARAALSHPFISGISHFLHTPSVPLLHTPHIRRVLSQLHSTPPHASLIAFREKERRKEEKEDRQ
ncbi:putative serine/threonine protein kinase [Blattamonas nauphoetae]|uniref:Serine/threonine protein kinase n=1 Tax=Blattamonas nauphoetae TaxID=2049346 RepID=A0ABQ9YGE3_9EUKA|nr:putative serine/threonine protein kinase [Blattamonas nauphoetae]